MDERYISEVGELYRNRQLIIGVVRRINNYLNDLEKMRYYDQKEVWGPLTPCST